ncbi:MAG: hypothetical protein HKN22_03265, partial [Bacteroidia bacterium]|nr:hypothetical protein [Bacteroidia bacterium]
IGPVIENMLNQEGIFKWTQLKSENVDNLKKIIYKGGDNFKIHDPSTWPKQASLADSGKWDELKEWQKNLRGGKIV